MPEVLPTFIGYFNLIVYNSLRKMIFGCQYIVLISIIYCLAITAV